MSHVKKTFRIGTLAKTLAQEGVYAEPSAIRFWEKEFNVQPKRTKKGHRFYTQEDLDRFILINDLLHNKKYTIAGAKRFFTEQKNLSTKTIKVKAMDTNKLTQQLCQNLEEIKARLLALKNLL